MDPDPDPTPYFNDFKDAKKILFFIFFYNLPAGTLSSVFKAKRGRNKKSKSLYPTRHLYEKREGYGSGSIPLKMDPDPDPADLDPQHCVESYSAC
jgi:hypothetical protein